MKYELFKQWWCDNLAGIITCFHWARGGVLHSRLCFAPQFPCLPGAIHEGDMWLHAGFFAVCGVVGREQNKGIVKLDSHKIKCCEWGASQIIPAHRKGEGGRLTPSSSQGTTEVWKSESEEIRLGEQHLFLQRGNQGKTEDYRVSLRTKTTTKWSLGCKGWHLHLL